MAYSPKRPPEIQTLDELREWVEEELRAIALEFADVSLINLRPVYRDVAKPRDGMLIYADGVSFNPGAGAGTYERKGGAWVKL